MLLNDKIDKELLDKIWLSTERDLLDHLWTSAEESQQCQDDSIKSCIVGFIDGKEALVNITPSGNLVFSDIAADYEEINSAAKNLAAVNKLMVIPVHSKLNKSSKKSRTKLSITTKEPEIHTYKYEYDRIPNPTEISIVGTNITRRKINGE